MAKEMAKRRLPRTRMVPASEIAKHPTQSLRAKDYVDEDDPTPRELIDKAIRTMEEDIAILRGLDPDKGTRLDVGRTLKTASETLTSTVHELEPLADMLFHQAFQRGAKP